MPSFDVVCEVDTHEVDNALSQAQREIGQRYDFRGTETSIERTQDGLVVRSSSDGRLDAALEVLREKLVRRKVSLKALDPQEPQRSGGSSWRQLVKIKDSIETAKAREIVKILKDSKVKVQSSIQGPAVRVSGKKRDDLQACIAVLKEQDLDLPLRYTNFRD